MKFSKWLYSLATLLAAALVVPVFLFFRRGRIRLADRIGFWNCRIDSSIWLHGASLGETIGLMPVAAELKQATPELFGTSTSPTALSKMQQFCRFSRLLPFDHPFFFKGCVSLINPKILVVSETEIWPNLLGYLNQKKIPVLFINGTISETTYANYKRMGSLFKDALQVPEFIFAADSESAERFMSLGVKPEKLQILANSKYDQPDKPELSEIEKLKKRQTFFKNDARLVVFASIRPGEEKLIFPAISQAAKEGLNLNFIIAPRHQEKFSFFEDALKAEGLNYEKRTSGVMADSNLLFLDTHGELVDILAVSDLAFVGGTLADGYGGHNPLEAAQFAVPLLIGTHDYNIRDVVLKLESAAACITISNQEDLLGSFRLSAENLKEYGQNAKKVCNSFAGSSKIIADKILSLIRE